MVTIFIRMRDTMATKTVRNGKENLTKESQIRNGAFSLAREIFGIKSLNNIKRKAW